MKTETTSFKFYATTVGHLHASATVATIEDARAIAALFPKSTKVRATTLTRPIDDSYLNGSEVVGLVTFNADLRATGTTGAVNETGLKRWRSFRKHAARLGFPVEYRAPYTNSLSADEAAALGELA